MAVSQEARRPRGYRQGSYRSYAAALFRYTPPGGRSGSAQRAGDAGPRGHSHHSDIYTCGPGKTEEYSQEIPSEAVAINGLNKAVSEGILIWVCPRGASGLSWETHTKDKVL